LRSSYNKGFRAKWNVGILEFWKNGFCLSEWGVCGLGKSLGFVFMAIIVCVVEVKIDIIL